MGCSHNACTYCDMYTGTRFRVKPWEVVERDLLEAAAAGPVFDKVFLCDGDALILPDRRLLQILDGIREHLPWVRRVGVYGDTRSVGRRKVEALAALRAAGLGIVYHGVESGDDVTLSTIDKGGTRAECGLTADKLREAGILHSVIVLLGIGGVARSEAHAHETATLLTRMDPPYVGALTTTAVPGTLLAAAEARGDFVLPDRFRLLEELRTLVEVAKLSDCRFSSNHASNYLPLRSQLPNDRERLLAILDQVLATRDEQVLRPEWMRGL